MARAIFAKGKPSAGRVELFDQDVLYIDVLYPAQGPLDALQLLEHVSDRQLRQGRNKEIQQMAEFSTLDPQPVELLATGVLQAVRLC